jgi:hypothetical protein
MIKSRMELMPSCGGKHAYKGLGTATMLSIATDVGFRCSSRKLYPSLAKLGTEENSLRWMNLRWRPR